jgi:DNA-binding YbaB/EbfC family protein
MSEEEPETPETGMPDLSSLMETAQEMLAAGSKAAEEVVTGSAGGGAVSVVVNGRWEFQSISISDEVVASGDREMMEDLVLAALRDAAANIEETQLSAPGGMDLSNLDLGGLDISKLLGGE